MPYRIDLQHVSDEAIDRLISLGALDLERIDGGVAALMPDAVSPEKIQRAVGATSMKVSPARARDGGSTWILSPGPVRVGSLELIPANQPARRGALRLKDSDAFGTGLHATTMLCLEALDEICSCGVPSEVLDIGTGSGVLALAALIKDVPRAVGLDVDPDAVQVAAENARLNGLEERIELVCGDAGAVTDSWPLVFANILAAPLMEMAPVLVRRVGHNGKLILSGIPNSVAANVETVYRHLGMRLFQSSTRSGWTALVLTATW